MKHQRPLFSIPLSLYNKKTLPQMEDFADFGCECSLEEGTSYISDASLISMVPCKTCQVQAEGQKKNSKRHA